LDKKLNINESFICKIWESAGEYLTTLKTADGNEVEVIDYGKKNFDSGPDYLDAVIKIGGKVNKGHVEVHQDFKHWFEHNHLNDRKYVSVILQVVLWDSKNRKLPKLRIKRDLPTVILANHLKYSIHHIWQEIINKPSSKTKLPCTNLNDEIQDNTITEWFSALAIERLKLKSQRIKDRLLEIESENEGKAVTGSLKNKASWEQVFYELIFEALGFSKNKEQMMKLARSFRLKDIIASPALVGRSNLSQGLSDNLRKMEKSPDAKLFIQSALFGLSGLLFDLRVKDEYTEKIKSIWNELENSLNAPRLSKSDWHFFRMRPQNFPTKRIAYGSQFIIKLINEDLLKEVILLFQNNELEPKEIYKYLAMFIKPVKDEYWDSHYNLGKKSAKSERLLGAQRIDDIIVNVITPLLFIYSDIFAKRNLKNRVLDFYTGLKTNPDNSVVKLINSQIIKRRKININTPAMEQAAIQLFNFYCTRERCDYCVIGKKVFKDSGYEYKIIYY